MNNITLALTHNRRIKNFGGSTVKSISSLSILIMLLVVIVLAGYYIASDRKVVLARYMDPLHGEFVVAGESENLIEGWTITLCWRKGEKLWYRYYIDHESSKFKATRLYAKSNVLHVRDGAVEVARLDMANGSLLLVKTGQNYDIPAMIVLHESLFDQYKRLYPDSTGWKEYFDGGQDKPLNVK